jgi:hypothetical protein
MEEYAKAQIRLTECYRGSNSKEEAEENCKQYADKMTQLVNDGALEFKNVMTELWKNYHKTTKYYKPNY